MEYTELNYDNLIEASDLVWEVFSEFVAPGYLLEGVETFRKFIQPDELKKNMESGKFFMLGGFDGDRLVGVAAVRDLCHISLFFVDKAYQGRGISKKLFERALKRCIEENPDLDEISVNSSPYAVEIYKKLGFCVVGEETTTNGITFVPMKMDKVNNAEDNSKRGEIRHIRKNELKDLLQLYKYLNKDDPELKEGDSLNELWAEILKDPFQHYLVTEVGGKPVASCVLVIVNNLTRNARPYGIIENVVTHERYRNKGYGTRLLEKALEIARDKGCYKVMLLTSRGEDTIRFYEKVGFVRGKKTGLIVRFD